MTFDYSQYGGVLVGRQHKVLTITLNSPETLNTFTGPMHTIMSRIWDDANDDPDVHAVVLTGAGRAFSAGGNVIAMQRKIDDPDAWEAGMPEARRIVFRMLECDKPIIARLNGHAVGLGATIALLCDIIIAADHAKIGDPHVNAGLVAGDGGALIWPQLTGFARAKEYLFTGDLMTAAEAERIGLINHVVPADQLDDKVYALARRLAGGAMRSIRWTKQAVNIPLRQLAHSMMYLSFVSRRSPIFPRTTRKRCRPSPRSAGQTSPAAEGRLCWHDLPPVSHRHGMLAAATPVGRGGHQGGTP